MTGLALVDLKRRVVMPTLATLQTPGGMDAVCQVTGTAAAESGCTYLAQHGDGPALGLFQMEPFTEQDIWHTYLAYHADLAGRVRSLLAPGPTTPQLVWNLAYAAAMCRIKYLRAPQRLSSAASGMAVMWKAVYNSDEGAGEVDEAHVDLFEAAIQA